MICKKWKISFSWLAILTFLNILLTTKLLSVHDGFDDDSKLLGSKSINASHARQALSSICSNTNSDKTISDIFDKINVEYGRFDRSRQYKIFDNVYVGEKFVELSKEFDVTLASQASLDRLHWLIHVAKMWRGPISVSIFVPDVEFEITKMYLRKLISCVPEIRNQVSFHMVFPVTRPPKKIVLDAPLIKEYQCANLSLMTIEFFKSINLKNGDFQHWRTSFPYPQSHMRNVARKASQTNYVFLTDIDIIPSKDSAETLSTFVTTNKCTNCAFVVPVYEINSKVKFPNSKPDLMQLVKAKKARPFHVKVFLQSQYATNITLFETEQDDSLLHVSHEVTNYEFFYEPFYVALDTVPEFDERFIGYGFTRNTQVYEMWKAGWKFLVLSPIFAVHYGFQEKRNRPSWREIQNNRNRKKLDRFKQEVEAKYKKSVPKKS